MLQIYDEKGKNRLNLSGEAFKELKNGLPVANIGYGVDCTAPVKNVGRSEMMFYPTDCRTGKKVFISYWLPFRGTAVDTKTSRKFKITHKKSATFDMGEYMYPLFEITDENGKPVAYLQGEEYHKD